MEEDKLIVRFGVLSDIQYADMDDRLQIHSGQMRYYRNSTRILASAVQDYNSIDSLKMVLHLGDIVDGYAGDSSTECLEKVVTLFDALNVPHHHIIGNHCIYNMKKEMVTTRLGISRLSGDSSKGYYTISLSAATSTTPAIRLIALDTYDISTIAYPDPNHPKHIKALQIVTKHNHGDLLNPSTMRGNNKRFVLFNGGVDTEQLHWLDETLAQAAAAKEKVIIASHNPLSPTVANIGLCWNYEEIEAILHRYGSDVVILCLSGHTHSRGDATDHAGIHHTTLEAVLEAGPTDVPCYGTVSVFVDRIVIKGCGSDDAFATSEVFFNTGRRRTRSRSQRK